MVPDQLFVVFFKKTKKNKQIKVRESRIPEWQDDEGNTTIARNQLLYNDDH